jgi:hypothetical protein
MRFSPSFPACGPPPAAGKDGGIDLLAEDPLTGCTVVACAT